MKKLKLRLQTALLPLRMGFHLHKPRSIWSVLSILFNGYSLLFSIGIGNRRPTALTFHFLNKRFVVTVESSADLAVIREIFLDQEYIHKKLTDCKTIFDVGANIGIASLYFHALYPDAIIYAFEPDPILFKRLREHTKDIPTIHPVEGALSDVDGSITFFSSPDRPLSGSIVERVEGEHSHIVTSYTIRSFAERMKIDSIDILKFDIEGGEARLLSAKEDRLLARHLIGEVHLDILKMDKETFSNSLPEFKTRHLAQTFPNRHIIYAEYQAA